VDDDLNMKLNFIWFVLQTAPQI